MLMFSSDNLWQWHVIEGADDDDLESLRCHCVAQGQPDSQHELRLNLLSFFLIFCDNGQTLLMDEKFDNYFWEVI